MNFFGYLTELEDNLRTARRLADGATVKCTLKRIGGGVRDDSILALDQLEVTVLRLKNIVENLLNDRPWRFTAKESA